MVSADEIKEVNDKFQGDGLVGIFQGGTKGIGEETAYAFARHVTNPTIIIIGRTGGEVVVDKIKSINPSAKATFLSHDLTLVSATKLLISEITQLVQKVNFLCLTAGGFPESDRIVTSEGISKWFALKYLVRFQLTAGLIPLLQAAAKADPGQARVVNVLGAGYEGEIDVDDLQLEKDYGVMKVMGVNGACTSLTTELFAKKYPELSFCHRYPGFIKTNVFSTAPWYFRVPLTLTLLFAPSADVAGEAHFYHGVASPDYAKGSYLLGASCNRISLDPKLNLTEEKGEKVWDYTFKLLESHSAGTSKN